MVGLKVGMLGMLTRMGKKSNFSALDFVSLVSEAFGLCFLSGWDGVDL
jgi:hypothetical protein